MVNGNATDRFEQNETVASGLAGDISVATSTPLVNRTDSRHDQRLPATLSAPGIRATDASPPLFGKIFAWVAIVFGALFLIGAIASFEFGAVLVGALLVGAGVMYLRSSPARGRKVWAVPAIAVLPALFVMGLTTTTEPETTTAIAPVAAVPALPTVTTTVAPTPSTTTPARTTTTAAPTTEAVAAELPTTTEYIPLPEPVYIPEPVYTPEPIYTAPAPLAAVPSVVSYANCDAVRAAGAAPIYTGDPGYSTKLDRDEDGVGCEN